MTTAFDFEKVFDLNLSRAHYVEWGSASEFTLRRNRQAFEWVDLIPRPAVNIGAVDTATELFGLKMQFPIMIAPTGGQRSDHPEGPKAMYRGAAEAHTAFILSDDDVAESDYHSQDSFTIKDIASAAKGPMWYQLFPIPNLDASRQILDKALAAGCKAVVVTVDQQTFISERSARNRNLGGRARSSAGNPFLQAKNNPYGVPDFRMWYTWDWVDALRKHLKVPMLIKGILRGDDAKMCVERGMDGVIVSNHGGKGVDYSPSSLEVLPEVVNAVQGRIPVITDSGYRRGSDIAKGLALGAKAILLGQAPRWGLGAFGAAGVQRVLEIMQRELVSEMATLGFPNLNSLNRDAVRVNFP